MVTGWRVEVRDRHLNRVGPLDVFTRLEFTVRRHRAGAWSLTVPAVHPQVAALYAEGAGIIVWAPWQPDRPFLSGPMVSVETVTRTVSSPALATVTGTDDLGLLADRLVYPDPQRPAVQQDAVAHYVTSGTAEKVIREVVNVNAGRAALPHRRLCDAGSVNSVPLGGQRTVRARFDNLLELVAATATTDRLLVSLTHAGDRAERLLDVQPTRDVTASVRLSLLAGTLDQATATTTAPQATHVLLAGGGEGTSRVFVERGDDLLAGVWQRRIERFQDARDTTDETELAERATVALSEATATAGIALSPVDVPTQRFGYDYTLGDLVTVDVAPGVSYVDTISEVTVTVTDGTARAVPVVGDANVAATTPAIYALVRDLRARIEHLERRR